MEHGGKQSGLIGLVHYVFERVNPVMDSEVIKENVRYLLEAIPTGVGPGRRS